MKCHTLSICVALVLIIVYATSGLYTLLELNLTGSTPIQLTTNSSRINGTSLLSIISSLIPIDFNWLSLAFYFLIVLLIIILLCGIQCNTPCLVFVWTITMIVMLLADGCITILTLQHNQTQPNEISMKMKILFGLMVARLTALLCGIFITSCYYRRVTKPRLVSNKREQRFVDVNQQAPVSPIYNNSWTNSAALLNPGNDISDDDEFTPNIPPLMPVQRTQVASIQQYLPSQIFQPRESFPPPADNLDDIDQSPATEYNEENRYNIPLQELHHQQITNIDDEQPQYQNTQ